MTTIPAENETDQVDNAYRLIYQTVHSVFYTELDGASQYTVEELSIEAV
jgi:hypothetical protein